MAVEETLTYESASARLEAIIAALDSGESGLRETLAQARRCSSAGHRYTGTIAPGPETSAPADGASRTAPRSSSSYLKYRVQSATLAAPVTSMSLV